MFANICQDRLGTNIRKNSGNKKRDVFFLQPEERRNGRGGEKEWIESAAAAAGTLKRTVRERTQNTKQKERYKQNLWLFSIHPDMFVKRR
jgi:hypothetical protein